MPPPPRLHGFYYIKLANNINLSLGLRAKLLSFVYVVVAKGNVWGEYLIGKCPTPNQMNMSAISKSNN